MLSTGGDTHLGGEDFDDMIVDHFMEVCTQGTPVHVLFYFFFYFLCLKLYFVELIFRTSLYLIDNQTQVYSKGVRSN